MESAALNRNNLPTERTWTDQPVACEGVPIVLSFRVNNGRIEVRAKDEPSDRNLYEREYLITIGNLFESQTVRVYGEEKMFEILRLAVATTGHEIPLPRGVTIVSDGVKTVL